MIAKDAKGFYCVSSIGVTGTRKEIKTDVSSMVKLVKEANDIPCDIRQRVHATWHGPFVVCFQITGSLVKTGNLSANA